MTTSMDRGGHTVSTGDPRFSVLGGFRTYLCVSGKPHKGPYTCFASNNAWDPLDGHIGTLDTSYIHPEDSGEFKLTIHLCLTFLLPGEERPQYLLSAAAPEQQH